MKLVIFVCFVAAAVAAPQFQEREVVLLRDDRVDNGDGSFNYAVEADNGINTAVSGFTGSQGQTNMEGSYTLTLEDGSTAVVRFVADANGFRPESSILPTPHPTPAHVIRLLEIAADQRARGITFE